MNYEIKVCPVCREQLEDSGGWDGHESASCHHQEFGGHVEPVIVPVVPAHGLLEAATRAAAPVLAEQRRKHETREAQLDWWRSQPQEWREEQEAKRRAAMDPMARAVEDALRDISRSILRDNFLDKRPLWGGVTVVPGAKKSDASA